MQEERHEGAMRLLGGSLSAEKEYEEFQLFLQQFEKPLRRYKFLVLSGPSQVGKAAFARSLCDPGIETLDIN